MGSLQQRAAALAVVSRVTDAIVSEGDLDDVLEGIVRATTELLGAHRGSLMLIEADGVSMRIRAATGIAPEIVEKSLTRLGSGIAGCCAKSGEAVLIRDIRELDCPSQLRDSYRTRSAICVPLRIHAQTLGVLNINDRRDALDFSEDDFFVAQIIARQAAVAISNSRLLAESAAAAAAHQSLDIARQIQQSLIPADLEVLGAKLSALSLPCDRAGGDYVDFWRLRQAPGAPDERNGEFSPLFVAIGDVSGHGVGTALIMATCRALLRALISQSLDLSDVMGRLNRLIRPDLKAGNFMTMLIGVFDPDKGELSYASAGHDPPLLQRASGGDPVELAATAPPLGVLDEIDFPTRQIHLDRGDVLVFTTDGVWEAQNRRGERFGRERLGQIVRELSPCDPHELIRGVEQAVCAHAHPQPLRDDLSLLVLRRDLDPLA